MRYILLFFLLLSTTANLRANPVYYSQLFNQMMETQVERYHIPGLSIRMAHNGKMIYSKDYGTAKDKGLLNYPGDISGILSRIAILQLADQGVISLEDDAFKLTGLRLRGKKGITVTIKDLMTHSHSLEHTALNIRTLHTETPVSATGRIKKLRPRISGKYIGINKIPYSASVLALIIENKTKKRFEDYMQENVFRPLQLNSAAYNAASPNSLNRSLSLFPADSGIFLNEEDISRLLLFLSDKSSVPGTTHTDKYDAFFTTINKQHPEMPGCSLIMCETLSQREPVFYSEDYSDGIHTQLMVMSESGTAIYIQHHSRNVEFLSYIKRSILLPPENQGTVTKADLTSFDGFYKLHSAPDSGADRMWYVITGRRIRTNTESGFLTAEPIQYHPAAEINEPISLYPVSDSVFRALESQITFLFRRDKLNNTWNFLTDEAGLPIYKAAGYLENPYLNLIFTLVFIYTFFKYSIVSMHSYCDSWAVHLIGRTISFFNFIFVIFFYPVFMQSPDGGRLFAFSYDITFTMYFLLTLPLITLPLNIITWIWLPVTYRIYSVSFRWFRFSFVNILFYLFLYHWNFLGYTL